MKLDPPLTSVFLVFPGQRCQFGFSPPHPGHSGATAAVPPQAHSHAGEGLQNKGREVRSPGFIWQRPHCSPVLQQSTRQLYLQQQPRYRPAGDANEESALRTAWHQAYP